MKKKRTPLQKINDLFRRARVPAYLHHYGPKKYTSKQHLKCFFLKECLKCSWRTLLPLLPYFGIRKVPERTTLIKFVNRLPIYLFNLVLFWSAKTQECMYAAIDSTGISRTQASSYYIKRIDREDSMKSYLKLSIMVDVLRRKILSARVRAKPCHDVKDVGYLVKRSPVMPNVAIMDKGYDSKNIHALFREKGTYTIIPARKSSQRKRWYPRSMFRREMYENFPKKEYGKRNIVESVISSVKRKFSGNVRSRTISGQRAEVYARLILHNISLAIARLFHLSLYLDKNKPAFQSLLAKTALPAFASLIIPDFSRDYLYIQSCRMS